VRALLFAPGGYVFAGTTTGLCRTSDAGTSWDSVAFSGLPSSFVSCLAAHPGGDLFAGCPSTINSAGGLFRSTDSGDHWTQVFVYGYGLSPNSNAID
jgi:photosystem II stability/assembly factor-like uncharacterized protein